MINEEFKAVFDRQVKQCATKLLEKSAEYSRNDDKLHNFKIAAALKQETPSQALWGMQVKHLVSITDMVDMDGDYSTAVWDEKIGDAINYLILLRALVFEKEMDKKIDETVNLDSMPALDGLVKLNGAQPS